MGKNLYYELKEKHQGEFNKFPCFFAFSNKQFDEGMEKLGLNKDDTDKIYRGIGGMFYRKTDSKTLKDMLNRHEKEMEKAINEDIAGENFVKQMFSYELANHEYGCTYELDVVLDSLGLTYEEIQEKPNLKRGLELALNKYK